MRPYGMDFEFPKADLLNALTPQVAVDFYCEILGGEPELQNVNLTITTQLAWPYPFLHRTLHLSCLSQNQAKFLPTSQSTLLSS